MKPPHQRALAPHRPPKLIGSSNNHGHDERPAVEYASTTYLPPDTSRVDTFDSKPMLEGDEKKATTCQYEQLRKEVEEFLASRRLVFEEKMFEAFYMMRIEQSKRFIELTDKINKSWDDFVEYLKTIASLGASGDGDCTVYSLTNSTSLTALSQLSNE